MRFIRKHRRWNHYLVAGKIRLPSGKILDYYGEIKTHSAISDILLEGQWLDLLQTNESNGTAKANDIILVATPYFKINARTSLVVSIYYPNQMSLSGVPIWQKWLFNQAVYSCNHNSQFRR